ncbi:DUF523 domain-containing protein [Tepidibacter formicigenes]|uniref:Uncharacterized conserved protein YbbK, DUF523 family n=1 Tax=Tepidibacter formicigenes DSM 15518 TaxID=1123349 RepID=A0A1M6KRR2_9FIRM|nr:DUF523 domain-containing protein [Tepidibacter formicigenes]SHJ61601.1 Uncharacterized conserved protein YbbK, DUF523 family [Tepidibacter formicigenes DSM 15518]
MILVSACLLGINCKYNGENNENKELINYLKDKEFVPVCPEQLGGLSTPRIPAEIVGGDGVDVLNKKAKVINKNGEDVTEEFLKGAYETLKIVKMFNCKEAILKLRSPSCGTNQVYNGTFTGELKDGLGVTAALFKKEGINLKSEEEF